MLKASGVSTKPPREGGAQLGYNPRDCSPNAKTENFTNIGLISLSLDTVFVSCLII